MNNAKTILEGLKSAGYTVSGGVNAPYIWLKTPDKMTSWEFFDYLLEKANVVGTPGSGFGPSGEGYFRLTAFGSYENTVCFCPSSVYKASPALWIMYGAPLNLVPCLLAQRL